MTQTVRRPFACLLAVAFLLEIALHCPASDVAYWTWHRSEPLSESDQAELRAQNVRTIFWYAGEAENRTGEWRWKTPPVTPDPQGGPTGSKAGGNDNLKVADIVPVVRLSGFVPHPFN